MSHLRVGNRVDRVLSVISAPVPLLTIMLTLILITLSLISGIALTYVEWAIVVLTTVIGVLFSSMVYSASVWYVALRLKPTPRKAIAMEDVLVSLIVLILGNLKQFWLTPLEMMFAKHWILKELWFLELIIVWALQGLQIFAFLFDSRGLRDYSSYLRLFAMLMVLTWLFSLLIDFAVIELPVLLTIQQSLSFFVIEIFIFVFAMLYLCFRNYLLMRYSLFKISVFVSGNEQDVDEFDKVLKSIKDLEYEYEAIAEARKGFYISEGYIPVLKLVSAWLKQCKDKESSAGIALPSPYIKMRSYGADEVEHIETTLKFLEGLSRWQTLKISFRLY